VTGPGRREGVVFCVVVGGHDRGAGRKAEMTSLSYGSNYIVDSERAMSKQETKPQGMCVFA
jgi:hypothetical protein